MADLVISDVHIVDWIDKFDAPSDEVFDFEAVRYAADGRVTPANGSGAGEATFEGIAVNKSTRIGEAITVVRDGLLDVGNALSALAIGALVYLSNTDGTLADAAGTVSVVVGKVVPAWGNPPSGADKLLRVRKGIS